MKRTLLAITAICFLIGATIIAVRILPDFSKLLTMNNFNIELKFYFVAFHQAEQQILTEDTQPTTITIWSE